MKFLEVRDLSSLYEPSDWSISSEEYAEKVCIILNGFTISLMLTCAGYTHRCKIGTLCKGL